MSGPIDRGLLWHGSRTGVRVLLLSNLRYSARSFARAPGLAVALLVTIALGIGSDAAVLGFIRGLVTPSRTLPGSQDLVSLFARDGQDAFGPVSYDLFTRLRTETDVFAALGAARESQASVETDGRSRVMSTAALTPDLAGMLRLSLHQGAVISRRVWLYDFQGKTVVPGMRVRVDGVSMPITGVAPEGLDGLYTGRGVDIWMPLDEPSIAGAARSSRTLWAIGRLRLGVYAAQAEKIIGSLDASQSVAVLPYTGVTPEVAGNLARLGRLLPAAAGAVFFIACANVAAFLLSRASARSRETSVRVAIGASRAQLTGQLLADSVLISVMGGALGVLLAAWTGHIIPALFFDEDAEHLVFVQDTTAFAVASLACVVITVACGLAPLFELRHDDPAAVLRRESSGPSLAMRRLRTGLVVGQMACCCLLVISAGLLRDAFQSALRTDAGNRLGHVVLATVQYGLGFSGPEKGLAYFDDAERAVQALAEVSETAWTASLPGGRPAWRAMRIEPPLLPVHDAVMDVTAFTPDSLKSVVAPPLVGRMFGGRDTPQSCKVGIVNENAARAVFNGDAVGRSVEDPAGDHVEIIGVVATRHSATAIVPDGPAIYYYADQTNMPLDRPGPAHFLVPDLPPPTVGAFDTNVVSPNYFVAMGMSFVAGRAFTGGRDLRGCRVGVVNQEAAERYFDGRAIGGAVIDGAGQRTQIIGVVHSALLRSSQRRVEPTLYLPMTQDYVSRMTLMISGRESIDAPVTAVRRRLDTVPGGNAGATVITTLDAHLGRTALAPERIASLLVGVSALMALVLGVLGLYGAMADSVRRQTRDFALRIALGAPQWRVIRHVMIEGARLAAVGAIVGVLGSIFVARWLARVSSVGRTTDAHSLWMWLTVPAVLFAVVVIASILPVRRALGVHPLTVMREE